MINPQRIFILILSLLTLVGCGAEAVAPSVGLAAVSNRPLLNPPLNGLWQTEGYGQLYEFEGDRFQIYSVTQTSCVPTLSGDIRPSAADDLETWLDIHILQENGVSMIGIQVQPGAHEKQKQFVIDGIASYTTVEQIEQWPEVCRPVTADTPLNNFDVFWQTYAEHYPFFELRGVDWNGTREMYRPQIDEQTSERELFDILQEMIIPLADAHTWIQPLDLDDVNYEGQRHDPNPLTKADWERTAAIVENNYLQTPITTYLDEAIAFGMLPDDIGYLRINRFADYVPNSDFWDGMAELNEVLDDIFAQPMQGLVIDIRANTGGADLYGLAVASRLTDSRYHAYTISARNDPTEATAFTAGQPIYVTPVERPGFDGPVVLLTSRYTVSAAETFTMALIKRPTPATHIGENTQGVFSVVLVNILPNGWWYGLQNERFLTEDGISFEGDGIPPAISQPVFSQTDLTQGTDSALTAALESLTSAIQNLETQND